MQNLRLAACSSQVLSRLGRVEESLDGKVSSTEEGTWRAAVVVFVPDLLWYYLGHEDRSNRIWGKPYIAYLGTS